jgi:hypothetical protein
VAQALGSELTEKCPVPQLTIAQNLCNAIRIEVPSAAETRNQMWELTMMQATLSYLQVGSNAVICHSAITDRIHTQAKLSSATKQIKQAISAARDEYVSHCRRTSDVKLIVWLSAVRPKA